MAAEYAIGDIQGCYDPLQRLLQHIDFDDQRDRLWFVGDLVNRGPDSLAVLRFIKNLPLTPRITLGNHDLHFLRRLFCKGAPQPAEDTLDELLNAPDREELGHWLRKQSLLFHDSALRVVMCHAGISPLWDLPKAKACARELEHQLSGEEFTSFLSGMYGNRPEQWSDNLNGIDRLRTICNYFTRMRFCDADGRLHFNHKGTLEQAPSSLYPWYNVPHRQTVDATLVFGHWAALNGKCSVPEIKAIDTGCVWGRSLTAIRLTDFQRFAVPGV
jgi:bis(5'-nucleosyl)-tetraphosphatase (symmetrical)